MDSGYGCICWDWMRPAVWKQEAEWEEKEGEKGGQRGPKGDSG